MTDREMHPHENLDGIMANIQKFCSTASNVVTSYTLMEDACLQVNWGANLLFVVSFIFFVKLSGSG